MPQRTAYGKKAWSIVLSVVVVNWNTPELLRDCIASIRDASTVDDIEIVVVDCASDSAVSQPFAADPHPVRFIQLERNAGYAAGCNAGAAASNGEFVLFLNADTTVAPDAIERMQCCFQLNPRVGLVAPLLMNLDGTVQSSGYRYPGAMNMICDLLPVPDRIIGSTFNGRISPGNGELPYVADYALGAAVVLRREALDGIGGWDENYGMYAEEIELARRLDRMDWTKLIEPRARIVHYGGASTSQQPAAMEEALWRSRGRYHQRWSSRRERALLNQLVNLATRLPARQEQGRRVRRAFTAGLQR